MPQQGAMTLRKNPEVACQPKNSKNTTNAQNRLKRVQTKSSHSEGRSGKTGVVQSLPVVPLFIFRRTAQWLPQTHEVAQVTWRERLRGEAFEDVLQWRVERVLLVGERRPTQRQQFAWKSGFARDLLVTLASEKRFENLTRVILKLESQL